MAKKLTQKNKDSIEKIIKTNQLFRIQIKDLQDKYDMTDIEQQNLNTLKQHLKNMNKLFENFKK